MVLPELFETGGVCIEARESIACVHFFSIRRREVIGFGPQTFLRERSFVAIDPVLGPRVGMPAIDRCTGIERERVRTREERCEQVRPS